MSERLLEPPHNSSAEREILGALLLNETAIASCTDLRSEHFFEPVHQRIFETIVEKIQQGEVPTPLTLKKKFDNDPALIDIGGANYLLKLAANASAVYDLGAVSTEIISQWQRRRIISCSEEAIIRASNQDIMPVEVSSCLAAEINDLDDIQKKSKIYTERDLIFEIIEDLKKGDSPDSTGIPALDEALGGGLFKGMLYGIGARKKVGKTALAATLAHNLAENQVPHMFIAAEMGSKQIYQRILARKLRVYPSIFRSEKGREIAFLERLSNASAQTTAFMKFQNAPGVTFNELKQHCARAVYKYKVNGIILDYLQIVGGEGSQGKVSHFDAVSQWLADFTKKHNIWIIVMFQLNQDGNCRFGEGIRLASEMVLALRRLRDDPTEPEAWVEMMDTRYTPWTNIGSEETAGLIMNEKGVYFEGV